jgi:dolichol-phosphate mannosyltransferase
MTNKDQSLEIVIPVYNEGEMLAQNISTIVKQCMDLEMPFTIWLVDDGSKDQSWQIIQSLCKKDYIKGLKLSRNFGKELAIRAGIDHCSQDLVLIMDADLQHPPELIPMMIEKISEENLDLVEAVKQKRGNDPWWYRAGLFFYNRYYFKATGLSLRDASDFKLLKRKVVLDYQRLNENDQYFRGLVEWLGHKKGKIFFEVAERQGGKTKFSPFKLLKLSVTSLISFSSQPLQLITWLGLLFLVFSVVLGVQTLIRYINGNAIEGFTTVILLLLVIGSTIMIALGIIGIYLAKIYDQVKNRPLYLISELED